MSRNKLYLILALLCATGFVWISIHYVDFLSQSDSVASVCVFKRITGIACPSCGSTRSVLSLSHGDFVGALYWNPMGFLLAVIMLVVPVWLVFDCLTRKDTLLIFYRRSEDFLRNKWVAVPAIVLVLTNWVWNIYKGL